MICGTGVSLNVLGLMAGVYVRWDRTSDGRLEYGVALCGGEGKTCVEMGPPTAPLLKAFRCPFTAKWCRSIVADYDEAVTALARSRLVSDVIIGRWPEP